MNTELTNTSGTKSRQLWACPDPRWVPKRPANQVHESGRLPIAFQPPANGTEASCPDCSAGDPCRLEEIIVDTLLKFVNLPVNEVDEEIEGTLRRVCTFLGIERAGLWRGSGVRASSRASDSASRDQDSFVLTHHWVAACGILAADGLREGTPADNNLYVAPAPLPIGIGLKEYCPWITAQAMRGRTFAFSRITELPAEAATDAEHLSRLGARSGVFIPFLVGGEVIGAVSFGMLSREREWPTPLLKRLEFVAGVLAHATARKFSDENLARSIAEINELRTQLQSETECLRSEIKISHVNGDIIGRSRGIRQVLQSAEQVAPAECPVLLSGETGTGKELIAQHIHRLSARKEKAMVLVNCAALPTALVESELFGRERGAYTGALTSQVGRFEVADGSTIFLDEVGELPMEVQAKLLRVLQQGEFQRLGSPRTHKVNVRVIAATNRDLAEEVRKGRFREDLYYRLKVFPIRIPPLRERIDDIPLLVFAFLEEFSTRMGKKITRVPHKAMERLQQHSWPGNIRELRNAIEHSVILTSADTLKLTVLGEAPTRESEPVTLAEAEREHIVKALEGTHWRIKGPHGAAQRLGLQPSTLYSRMQKLGIPHRRQKDELASPG